MKVTGISCRENLPKLLPGWQWHAVKALSALCCSISLLVSDVHAQTSSVFSSDALHSAILKSATLGSVLYIAAHPDDENTRLLSYLARERNFRTGYLSITRGDGGQNLIGKEQGDLLGLIRTQELLAARRVDGAEQFFTRACDFGYSKNPEETFSIWNKDSILSDVVWVIRKFRPDIIICRFPTTGEGGHGHHTASAILAEEAFSAAADPSRFPWQLAYTQPWQAKRLFWNTFNFGSTNTTSPDQLKIDVGVFNPLLGRSHGEIAAESRSNHKSQGFGSAAIRGSSIEYFRQLKGDSVSSDLFEGINTDWNRLAGTAEIERSFKLVVREFDHRQPEKSVKALVELYNRILALPSSDPAIAYWRELKSAEVERSITGCAGLWTEALMTDPVVTPGSKCRMKIQAVSRAGLPIVVKSLSFPDMDSSLNTSLAFNELNTWNHEFVVSSSLPWSDPYWLQHEHPQGIFLVDDLRMIGTPENRSPLVSRIEVELYGTKFHIDLPLVYKSTDPVRGEVYRPIEVLPPVTMTFDENTASFFNRGKRAVIVTIKSNVDSIEGTLEVRTTADWKAAIADSLLRFTKKGEEIRMKIQVEPGTAPSDNLQVVFKNKTGTWAHGIRRIKYDHIPEQFFLPSASLKLKEIELQKSDLKIGYIEGAGDGVAACLTQAGYDVTLLGEDDLQAGELQRYATIVTGVRAFNTEQQLIRHRATLLDFVRAGGNLVVQYNTNNRLGPAPEKIGPYPFTISNQRVTDERAEVRFLAADHPVLNRPNKITAADFEHWIQERGIYFASSIDSSYTCPLGMNDPGEKENNGSLIIAPYGKGNFVYTGLAFFRELPAGVPGAYRLFVNLIESPNRP